MALSLMDEADQAGVEVDAATVDAVLAALGKVGSENDLMIKVSCSEEVLGRHIVAWIDELNKANLFCSLMGVRQCKGDCTRSLRLPLPPPPQQPGQEHNVSTLLHLFFLAFFSLLRGALLCGCCFGSCFPAQPLDPLVMLELD